MQVNIERRALQTAMNSVMSCVGALICDEVCQAYCRLGDEDTVDFSALVEMVEDVSPKTQSPFHLLLEFASYAQDDPSNFTITHNDVIRLFSTKYHLDLLIKNLIDPMTVSDTSSFLVSHMLLPVLISRKDDGLEAEYKVDGRSIRFRNIFLSSELELKDDVYYGMHLGTAVTTLTDSQIAMIESQLALSEEFAFLVKDVTEVDFRDFQHFGDYHGQVAERYEKCFSL